MAKKTKTVPRPASADASPAKSRPAYWLFKLEL
jgi:hypothetical protein